MARPPMPDTLVRPDDAAASPDDVPTIVKPLLRGWSHTVSFVVVGILGLLLLALTSAARRTPETGRSADAIRRLSADVSRYSALVASARANNRQGLPIGAAYLSSASTLSRESLQPQAQALFQAAQSEVDDGYPTPAAPGGARC